MKVTDKMSMHSSFSALALAGYLAICLTPQAVSAPAMQKPLQPVKTITALKAPLALDVVAQQPISLRLLGVAGALVNLSIETGGTPFNVALKGDSGKHYRQFLTEGQGRKHIVFLLPDEAAHLLIESPVTGQIILTQTGMIAAAELVPPPRIYQSPRLQRLADNLAESGATDSFWREIGREGTPLVEAGKEGETLLTFLARGARKNVKMLGGPANDIYPLERLGDSDVWFRTVSVPAGTLFSYQLATDVPDFSGPDRARRVAILAKAKADPLNRHPWPETAPDAYNQSSTFRVAGGALKPWFATHAQAQGKLTHHRLASQALKNERDIWIYRSPGVEPSNEETPFLFVFDGEQFLKEGHLERSIDALVEAGKIPPLVAIFLSSIDNVVRAEELPDSDVFADFMAGELRSFVASQTGMTPKAERSILAGSSFGGLGATTIALKHPEAFGNVLSLSGSYWWSPKGAYSGDNMAARRVATGQHEAVRFYLAAGLFESTRGDGFASILEPNRHLRDVLTARNYAVIHEEYPSAHDMFAWREILPQGLITLLGASNIDRDAGVE